MTYAYCRVSTKKQDIQRQVNNIQAHYAIPFDHIIREVYTGKEMQRPEWMKLRDNLNSGDMIIFDSVSRMSRNAEEGIADYMALFNAGIELVFLNEPHINTAKYHEAILQAEQRKISIGVHTGDSKIDELLDFIQDWVNSFVLHLVSRDIRAEFEKAENEIADLSQRTSDGMKAKDASQKISEARNGKKYRTIKSLKNRIEILERSVRLGGTLTDTDLSKILGISTRTISRYSAEMMAELSVITKVELAEKLKCELREKQKKCSDKGDFQGGKP